MDTKLGIINLKSSRGKPPKLQSMIIFQLTKNGIQSKTSLSRTLKKSESNISKAISVLQSRGIVTSYQSLRIKKKPGRPRKIEIRDSASSNINRGRPHQFYGLTEKGIKLLLTKEANLDLDIFWHLIIHYFKPANNVNKLNIHDVFDQYEINVLGCERRLAFTTLIMQEIDTIDTIKYKIELKNDSKYIDLLCTLAYDDLSNILIIDQKLKNKIHADLEESNLIKRDVINNNYSLTLLGVLLFLQLIADAEMHQEKIKSSGIVLVFHRAKIILNQIEKIRNGRNFLPEISWPKEIRQYIFPYPHNEIGGSTWEDSIFYNALLDPFFENHSKNLPRIFGKLKKLRMIWSGKDIYLGLAFILKQVSEHEPMPRRSTIASGDGFQEIFDDFENLSSYYEEILEKEHSVGYKIYYDLSKNVSSDFDKENLFASDIIDELRIMLGYNVNKPNSTEIRKELANQLYGEILPEWISFKFYTYLFQIAKNEYKFTEWFDIFQNDKDLVNWYSEWLDKLNEYRNKATIKQKEFRNLFSV